MAFAGPASKGSLDQLQRAAMLALANVDLEVAPVRSVVAGVRVLENDTSFNAGLGSHLRADGRTLELDAAIMDSTGRFAAVGAIRDTPNPIRVAAALLDAPAPILVGDNATRLASVLGLTATVSPTANTLEAWAAEKNDIRAHLGGSWQDWPWSEYLAESNSEADDLDAGSAVDAGDASAVDAAAAPDAAVVVADVGTAPTPKAASTDLDSAFEDAGAKASVKLPTRSAEVVAILVRDGESRFAAAVSTGGITFAVPGSVGHLPVLGSGLYVGQRGAVVVAGPSASLVADQLARGVYQRLLTTRSPRAAADWGLRQAGEDELLSIVVLGEKAAHVAAAEDAGNHWVSWDEGEWSESPEEQKETP